MDESFGGRTDEWTDAKIYQFAKQIKIKLLEVNNLEG
jgi:hypothetical protein